MPTLIPSNAIPETILSFDGGSLSSTYIFVGTMAKPVEMMSISNLCTGEVILSFDGVNDHLAAPPTQTQLQDQGLLPVNFKRNLMTLPASSVFARIPAYVGSVDGTIYIAWFSGQIN